MALLPVAAVLCAVLGALLAMSLGGMSSSERLFGFSPSEVVVPAGASLVDAAGADVGVLGRSASDPGTDLLRVPLLEPGRYFAVSTYPSLAGGHFPAVSSVVVISDVVPLSPFGAPSSGSVIGVVLLLAVAFLAGLLPGRWRWAGLAGLVLLLGAWVAVGFSGSVSVVSAGAAALGLAAVACSLLWRPEALPQRMLSGVLAASGALLVLGVPAPAPWASLGAAALAGVGVALASRKRSLVVPLVGAGLVVLLAGSLPGVLPGNASGGEVSASVDECSALLTGGERQAGLDCFRGIAARIGASSPVSDASAEVIAVSESGEGFDPTEVCRQMGQAMSAAATRWGPGRADPRALFVDLGPICDYSSMHGIAPGLFAPHPVEGLGDAVVRFCSDSTPDESRLADYEYKAQCWQGTGIMLARKFNFDPAIFQICALAPREGIMNCSDGVFRELIDELARAAELPGSHFVPEGLTVASLCAPLTGDIIGGCYRYVGEEAEIRARTSDKTVGAKAISEVCQSGIPAEHDKFCWYAVGMITVRAYPGTGDDEAMRLAEQACEPAPQGEPHSECFVGAANAVMNRNWKDVDLDKLCLWFPEWDRKRLCENAHFYHGHLAGADA